MRALSRFIDQARYFWWTFRTRPSFVSLALRPDCSDRAEVRRVIKTISDQRFRGWIVVGFHVSSVMVPAVPGTPTSGGLCFDKWSPAMTAPWKIKPTHHEISGAYAKLLTLSTLYGQNVIFDLSSMDEKCWHELFMFLSGPRALLVGWDTWIDLWTLVRTKCPVNERFGYDMENPTIPLSAETAVLRKKMQYEAYALMRIRTYDLRRVVRFVGRGMPTFNLVDWCTAGCTPEGDLLPHLVASVLGVDIFPLTSVNDVTEDEFRVVFNPPVPELSLWAVRYASTLPQMMVFSFAVLLRYRLLSDLTGYFPGLEHDFRPPVSLDVFQTKVLSLATSKRALKQFIRTEGTELENFIKNPPADDPKDVGSVVNGKILHHLDTVPYFEGILPPDPANVECNVGPELWNKHRTWAEDDDEIEHPSRTVCHGVELGRVDPTETVDPSPNMLFTPEELQAFPGMLHPYDPFLNLMRLDEDVSIPHYLHTTYPRSRKEAMVYRAVAVRQYVALCAAGPMDVEKHFEPFLAHNNDILDSTGKLGNKADPYLRYLPQDPIPGQPGNLLFVRPVTYSSDPQIWNGTEIFSDFLDKPNVLSLFTKLWRHELPQDPVEFYKFPVETPYIWLEQRVLLGFTSIAILQRYQQGLRTPNPTGVGASLTRAALGAGGTKKQDFPSATSSVSDRNLRSSTRKSAAQTGDTASSTTTQPSTKSASSGSTTKPTRKTRGSTDQGAVGHTMQDLASSRASSDSSKVSASATLASMFAPASQRNLAVNSAKVVLASSTSTSMQSTMSTGSVATPLTGPTSSTGSSTTPSTGVVSVTGSTKTTSFVSSVSTVSTVTPSTSASSATSAADNVFRYPTPSVIPPIGSAQAPFSLFGSSHGNVTTSAQAAVDMLTPPAFKQSLAAYDYSFQNAAHYQPPFLNAPVAPV